MGGLQISQEKYVILYGEPGSGKTWLQYQLQSSINLNTLIIAPTIGISYETVSIGDTSLGIFDCSGELQQYKTVDIVAKYVEISGIIFVVSLAELNEIDKARDSLERVLGNNYLNKGLCLFIIYNLKDVSDRIDWMSTEWWDNKLCISKLKKKYHLKYTESNIVDISTVKSEEIYYSFQEALKKPE